jgi:hypothetical protein
MPIAAGMPQKAEAQPLFWENLTKSGKIHCKPQAGSIIIGINK